MPATHRRSTKALLVLGVGLLGLILALVDSAVDRQAEARRRMQEQVVAWGLTDLALFTEARYTRHPSQADLHSAFQDHPGALEHFPTASLIAPPPHLTHAELAP